jgi:hypothetical protein
MAEDLIRYDILAQDALRGVVRKVLSEVARTGLPGEHHFFVSFGTTAPGVRISSRLLLKYPEEMTIVLQHQYRDLTVTEHAFEVGLSFGGISERLLVPFSSVLRFVDPSVGFKLEFNVVAHHHAVTSEVADEQPTIALVGNEDHGDHAAADGAAEEDDKASATGDAEIVSLDAFRKK